MTAEAPSTARPTGLRSRLGGPVSMAAWVVVAILGTTLIAKSLRAHGYVFDMAANFAAHFAWIAALCAIACLVARRWTAAAVLVVIALVHVGWLAGGRAAADRSGDGPAISVLHFNARTTNPTPERVVDLIDLVDADLVTMVEVPDRAIDLIRDSAMVRERYPYQSTPAHPDERNNIRLSKHPFEVLDLVDRSDPADTRRYVLGHTAIVNHPAGRFVHTMIIPISPRSPSKWAEGNASFRDDLWALSKRMGPRTLPWIIGIDMNGAPGSVRADQAQAMAGVVRAKPLGVVAGTWPSWLPGPVRIAIDDLVVTEDVRVRSWRVVPGSFGSDHQPIEVVVTVTNNHNK